MESSSTHHRPTTFTSSGYNTAIYRYLDARTTVILLTNHYGDKSSNADRLVRRVSGLIDPRLAWPNSNQAPTLLNEGGRADDS